MLRGLRSGSGGFFRAFSFALENGLWWVFVVPVLLWVALSYGLYAALQGPVDELTTWAAPTLRIPVDETVTAGWAGTWNAIKAFLNNARELLVGAVLRLAIAYLLYTFNKYLVLVLLSPLLAYASERTEEILTGRTFPFNTSQFLKDVWRGVRIALRNGLLELVITLTVWISTLFVPLLAPLAFLFLFLVSAYFYGFSMFDYVFERRRLEVRASVRAMNDHMGLVLANGACFSLLMKIPLVGICLAPSMAAIGAVLAMAKDDRGSTPQGASTFDASAGA